MVAPSFFCCWCCFLNRFFLAPRVFHSSAGSVTVTNRLRCPYRGSGVVGGLPPFQSSAGDGGTIHLLVACAQHAYSVVLSFSL